MRGASTLALGDDLIPPPRAPPPLEVARIEPRRAIVTAGDFFDWATGALMLAGLRERVAAYRRTS